MYKERDRRLKEQFIKGMSDKEMITELIIELTTIIEANKVRSEQVLCREKGVEAQRAQKALLKATKETKESKEFDAIKEAVKQNHSQQNTERSRGMPLDRCKCCGTLHGPRS